MGQLTLTITHPGIVGDPGKADVAQFGAMLIHVATEIGYEPPIPGQAYRKSRRIQGELIGAVYVYEGSESAPTPEPGDAPPTYHGILKATCHSCGHVYDKRGDLEVLNDLGEGCHACDNENAVIMWEVEDGTVGPGLRATQITEEGHLITFDGPHPQVGATVEFPEAYPDERFVCHTTEAGIYRRLDITKRVATMGGLMQVNHDATPWRYVELAGARALNGLNKHGEADIAVPKGE